MKTLKLSYSILKQWQMGHFDEAVAQYRGKELPTNDYFELGKIKHKIWENYILKHGEIHPELGGDALYNPIVEKKYQLLLPFNDEYQILLRGVIDCSDSPPEYAGAERLLEWKSGMRNATSYVDDMQADIYKLLRPKAVIAEFRCYNPYFKTLTRGVKYLDERNTDAALNYIYTYGGEMLDYLLLNKMFMNHKVEALDGEA